MLQLHNMKEYSLQNYKNIKINIKEHNIIVY